MGAHDFHGAAPSRHGRKLSKLGPGIITAERLDELLKPHVPTVQELEDLFRPDEVKPLDGDSYDDARAYDEGGEG